MVKPKILLINSTMINKESSTSPIMMWSQGFPNTCSSVNPNNGTKKSWLTAPPINTSNIEAKVAPVAMLQSGFLSLSAQE